MAFLDFIKNRNASPQQAVAEKSQSPKPETAQAMYKREAAQEKASLTPRDRMPPDQQAKVSEIKERFEKAMAPKNPNDAPSPAPAGGTASPEAMRQNMTGQEKIAPALSPTGAHMGQTAAEKGAQAAPNERPDRTPDKQPQRAPQTIARRPPSWER